MSLGTHKGSQGRATQGPPCAACAVIHRVGLFQQLFYEPRVINTLLFFLLLCDTAKGQVHKVLLFPLPNV